MASSNIIIIIVVVVVVIKTFLRGRVVSSGSCVGIRCSSLLFLSVSSLSSSSSLLHLTTITTTTTPTSPLPSIKSSFSSSSLPEQNATNQFKNESKERHETGHHYYATSKKMDLYRAKSGYISPKVAKESVSTAVNGNERILIIKADQSSMIVEEEQNSSSEGTTEVRDKFQISIGKTSVATLAMAEAAMTNEPPRYEMLCLVVIPLFTFLGNLLVCLSVYLEKNLKTLTNYYIFSLAVADIMVAVLVMPLNIYVETKNGKWDLGDILCDTWVASDVMCCTASILNLAAISVDRYAAVTRPLQYMKHKKSKRAFVGVACTWIISAGVSSPIALGMNYTRHRALTPDVCAFYNSDFLIYSSVCSFYAPCLLMMFLYWRIFSTLRLRMKRLKAYRKPPLSPPLSPPPPPPCPPSPPPPPPPPPPLLPSSSFSIHPFPLGDNVSPASNKINISEFDELRFSLKRMKERGEFTEQSQNIRDHRLCSSSGTKEEEEEEEDKAEPWPTTRGLFNGSDRRQQQRRKRRRRRTFRRSTNQTTSLDELPTVSGGMTSGMIRTSGRQDSLLLFDDNIDAEKNLEKLSVKLCTKLTRSTRCERKAIRTLAIVLAAFLVCWLPFFTVNIANAVCIKHNHEGFLCKSFPRVMTFFVWLGFFNSFLNPVIYTLFNPDFRKAFCGIIRRFLTCSRIT